MNELPIPPPPNDIYGQEQRNYYIQILAPSLNVRGGSYYDKKNNTIFYKKSKKFSYNDLLHLIVNNSKSGKRDTAINMITILCVSAEDTFNLKDNHIKESITASIEKLPISYAEFKKIANNKSMTSLLQIQEFKNDVNKNLIKCMYKQGTTEIQKFSERFDNFLDSVQNDCDDEGSLHMLKNWRYNNTTLPLKDIIKYIGNLDIMYTHLELPELKRFNVSIESPDYNFYFSHILYPIYCIKNDIIDLN